MTTFLAIVGGLAIALPVLYVIATKSIDRATGGDWSKLLR